MSQEALLEASRDRLRAVLPTVLPNLPASAVEVGFDGAPHPSSGEWFFSIHEGEWRAQSGDHDLDEYFGVCVTVTRRVTFSPKDRWGTAVLIKAQTGINAVSRKVITALHKNYAVLNAANVIVGTAGAGPDGFVEPLWYLNASPVALKGPDWFEAADDGTAGVARTLVFGRARRLQTIHGMT